MVREMYRRTMGEDVAGQPRVNASYFETDHLLGDLGPRSVRGGMLTLTAQAVKFVVQIGSLMILARLVAPSQFGLVAMVTAIVGFFTLFKDMGLSMATVQRRTITQEQVSNLFWVNVGFSVLLTGVVAAGAPLVAAFYHQRALTGITLVSSFGFLLSGVGVQHQALLQRQMKYLALVFIDLSSLLLGTTTGVVLAWRGAGYWSLVVMSLVTAASASCLYWLVCGWRPGLPSRGTRVRSLLAFGSYLSGFNAVNYFARNLDNILIGWRWGAQPLGLYSRAYQMLTLPLQQVVAPVAAVAVPMLSRVAHDEARYRRAYIRAAEKLAALAMPLMAFMICTSDWLVRVVLGPQWSGAARIFLFLGVAGLVQPVASSIGWLFISQDRTRDMFVWSLIGTAIIVPAFFVGLPYGALGVAVAYAVTSIAVTTPLLFWYVGRSGPVRARDFLSVLRVPLTLCLAVALALLAFRSLDRSLAPVPGLLAGAALTVVVVAATLAVQPSGRELVRDARELVKSAFERESPSGLTGSRAGGFR